MQRASFEGILQTAACLHSCIRISEKIAAAVSTCYKAIIADVLGKFEHNTVLRRTPDLIQHYIRSQADKITIKISASFDNVFLENYLDVTFNGLITFHLNVISNEIILKLNKI